MLILGIALAGALGALLRWGLAQLMLRLTGPLLPYGTLTANLLGCFILGVITEMGQRAQWMSGDLRVAISVGFIGALTTFSTWEFETMGLARRGDLLFAAANFCINVIFGYALIWAGARMAAAIWR